MTDGQKGLLFLGLLFLLSNDSQASTPLTKPNPNPEGQVITKSEAFDNALKQISIDSGIDLNLLFFHLWCESGLDPKAGGKFASSAAGVFGLLPKFAKPYIGNKTWEEFKTSTDLEQLKAFALWLKPFHNKIKKPHDIRLAGFAPAFFSQRNDENAIVYKDPQEAYLQNSYLDLNNDGLIMMWEMRERANQRWNEFLSLKKGNKAFQVIIK